MKESELLLLVLVDSFTSNLIFIFNSELAVWVTQKLSNIERYKILLAAFLGLLASGVCNYFFGSVIYKIMDSFIDINSIKNNTKLLKSIYQKFYYYLILLSFLPLYSKFVILFAGFIGFRPFMIIFAVALVRTIFFGLYG